MDNQNKPVVGYSTAFTGKYKSSKVIFKFLEIVGINTVKSSVTNPSIIEASSALSSADYCLPLRVYIGHIYHLLQKNKEIDFLVIPIIKRGYNDSATCAKYRDLDGVTVRSLGSITGYRLNNSRERDRVKFSNILGEDRTKMILKSSENIPRILAPEIESSSREHLRLICIQLYSDIMGINKFKELNYINGNSRISTVRKVQSKIETAFEIAYADIFNKEVDIYKKITQNREKPRLALVGRDYLVEDPTLSVGIKDYFEKNGVVVLTNGDIPEKYMKDKMDKVNGFYDSHKISQAFIDTVFNQVDGFILIGSFGCHPDAFQIEYLSKYISNKGKACWTFKYDEQTGGVGFETRYETILWFLQQKSIERNNNLLDVNDPDKLDKLDVSEVEVNIANESNPVEKPIFIWPYMGEGINLVLKEICHNIGLSVEYIYPPNPVNENTLYKGSKYYSEACSPFALYIGSLKETVERLITELTEPRRIIILMANGKGPCTFGWYSIVGEDIILEEYQEELDKSGHSIEMLSLDNEGRNLNQFLKQLADISSNDRISSLVSIMKTLEGKTSLNSVRATQIEIKVVRLIKNIIWSSWKKLLAFEDIQNKALEVRAHEKERGATTQGLKELLSELDEAHTLEEIEKVKKRGFSKLEKIPQDNEVKPRVVIVGEIYGTLTSFANRGAINNLLGSVGIEAVEGMRLSHFILGALKGLKNRFISKQPIIRNVIAHSEAKGYYKQNKWVRDPIAKPFLEHEIGGDGQPSVARARRYIEDFGVDGILHIYPFKCMPEAMAKDALKEMAELYGVKSLHLSYDKEIEIERLKTEINTFSTLLVKELELKKDEEKWKEIEIEKRQQMSKIIDTAYQHQTK